MHCQKLGQKGGSVIKVSRSNGITEVKNCYNRNHGFDLKTLISISNYSSSLRRYRGHYLFPLLSRQIQFDDGDTTFFTPDHDSGTSLAILISHPSTEGIFTSSRMSCRRERRSFGTVLLKAQLVILSLYKFHSFACDDDLIYPSFS